MDRAVSSPFRIVPHAVLAALLFSAVPARAVLDIEDRGPAIDLGMYNLRVTNAGILGNAFFDIGRSTDPSFEVPSGSGREALHYAALWVGGELSDGTRHVSGGPLLEFRPTLDLEDRVRLVSYGRPGTVRFADDDNDGSVDEERLDGRDDDGDGEVDEDLGLFSQRLAVARFVDDRPEAVNYVYPGGETHVPLGLTVDQDVYGWSQPGYDHAAGVRWVITNHTQQTIYNLYVGVLADLDSRLRDDVTGHLDDRIVQFAYRRQVYQGGLLPTTPAGCSTWLAQSVPGVASRDTTSGLPFAAFVPLWHTIDPLANFDSLFSDPPSRAPRTVGFKSRVFSTRAVPGQGGLPITDEQRYQAMVEGDASPLFAQELDDWVVLVSCGPFKKLGPGQSIELHGALVAAARRDTVVAEIGNVAVMERGLRFNRLPDVPGPPGTGYYHGESGINGHEVCLEVPPGVTMIADPHCPRKVDEPAPAEEPTLYTAGHCIWTDADCDNCTGANGLDTEARWVDPGVLPPAPRQTYTGLEHEVRVEWDNTPEVLLAARLPEWSESRFIGYRVWRASDWHDRTALVPDRIKWSLAANFAADTSFGAEPLSAALDTTVDYERIFYEQKVYPPGRYRWIDREAQDGFDYLYSVSAVYEVRLREPGGYLRIARVESPVQSEFDRRVTPRADATDQAGRVWVVPNPYRGSAPWERKPVFGDTRTRHVDFFGLPRARCTIKIWTLAGDLVAQLDHDGSNGNGQAPWDLISRSGQDVTSGIYLFTVDSSLGRQTGRFVVIR